ncbi:MAG: DUF885 domain-containing protein, partial [Lysobacteraceae bacterium]
MKQSLVLVLLLALAAAAPLAMAQASPADQSFQAIHEKEWKWRQASLGTDEDSDGASTDRLPDVGAAAQAGRLEVWEDVLRQLDAI